MFVGFTWHIRLESGLGSKSIANICSAVYASPGTSYTGAPDHNYYKKIEIIDSITSFGVVTTQYNLIRAD